MVEIISFKSTGVREIDKILFAITSPFVTDEIQAAADNAARIWKTLWVDGKL